VFGKPSSLFIPPDPECCVDRLNRQRQSGH
jgi:hypothetical protein